MSWTTFRDTVTVVDVLEGGACIDGVVEYLGKNRSIIGPPVDDRVTGDRLKQASNADGYGSGSGYGYGYGYGSGYG